MTPSQKSRRILVVEDEAIISRDIWQQLIALGHTPLGPARTGQQCIEMTDQLHPELVLMDINLRGPMDGIEAALVIRTQFGLPTIFLSAFNGDASRERAELASPTGFLSKPFTENELASAVQASFSDVDLQPQ